MLIVIIPTWQAESGLAQLLLQLEGIRVIVSDGGSTDRTLITALEQGAVIAVGAKGRGEQLRLGAHLATLSGRSEDWFLFLHADCRLPEDWRSIVETAMQRPDPRYFKFKADASGPKAWIMNRMVALRCWALGLPYGDQGLLISRALYEQVGGYASQPLFEDVDMVRRLRRIRRVRPLSVALTTDVSAHWHDGLWTRGTRNLRLLWRYWRGADVETLLRDYQS